MFKKVFAVSLFLCSAIVSSSYSQQAKPIPTQQTTSLEELKKQADFKLNKAGEEKDGSHAPTKSNLVDKLDSITASKPGDNKSVVLIINSENNAQLVVIDNNGSWLSNAKEVKITITVGAADKPPSIECFMYRGFIRPKNLKSQEFDLESIVLVDSKEFEEVINKLHDKP